MENMSHFLYDAIKFQAIQLSESCSSAVRSVLRIRSNLNTWCHKNE